MTGRRVNATSPVAVFDTVDRMREQLRAGEDGRAAFNSLRVRDGVVVAPNAEDLAGELVAFANAEGGAVFVGVGDSVVVHGLPPERVSIIEQRLLNVATHNCDPPIRPVIRNEPLKDADGDDLPVLLAEVPRGLYVHRTSGGRYYVRIGSTKRDLTPPELARLFQQRVESTCSTSSRSRLNRWRPSTATAWKHSSGGRRPSPGSICCATPA